VRQTVTAYRCCKSSLSSTVCVLMLLFVATTISFATGASAFTSKHDKTSSMSFPSTEYIGAGFDKLTRPVLWMLSEF
jgi:hypothetical protein